MADKQTNHTLRSSSRLEALRWIFRMAWRDSRGSRKKLILYNLGIVFGIAALVALNSFRDNLESAIDVEARSLLGADLVLKSRTGFPDSVIQFADSLGGEQAREMRFISMAWFARQEKTRLVQVRALSGSFPFYGEWETSPANLEINPGGTPMAIVEESLARQFGLAAGDKIKLGLVEYTVAGTVLKMAGESGFSGLFAPRVYVPLETVEATGLLQRGSLIRHRLYFAFEGGLDEKRQRLLSDAEPSLLRDNRIGVDTVAEQKEDMGRALDNLNSFLNLAGIIALILGGLGVSGAVQIYLSQKLAHVAILRCLGAPLRKAFFIYFIQVIVVGFAGAMLGILLGLGIQFLMPKIFSAIIPFKVELFISWKSISLSLVFGWIVTLLFSFFPLATLRNASPLMALRANIEVASRKLYKDRVFWLIIALITLVALFFSITHTTRWYHGVLFFCGLTFVLGIFALTASGLRKILRTLFRKRGPYYWRYGLSNLYRPNNRTLFLVTTLGVGVFLILTLHLTRHALLEKYLIDKNETSPSVFLFDIQEDQVEDVVAVVKDKNLPVMDTTPIVTMRINSIRGQGLKEIRENSGDNHEKLWALNWEYRASYRKSMTSSESLLKGVFTGQYKGEGPIPISIEESIAESLSLQIGDPVEFNVQGILLETRVGSIRSVDWQALRPNFFVLFPEGVIEDAPKFYAVTTYTPDRAETSALLESVVQKHPNVSAVDLSLVIETISAIMDKVALVIDFMSGFTIATGFLVLIGSIVTSRYQRLQESVLLRTLGASSSLIRAMTAVEFFVLGFLGATVGCILAIPASMLLCRYVFKIPFVSDWIILTIMILGVPLLTVMIGLWQTRGVSHHPPLKVLRAENS